jgi:hypothetical protein
MESLTFLTLKEHVYEIRNIQNFKKFENIIGKIFNTANSSLDDEEFIKFLEYLYDTLDVIHNTSSNFVQVELCVELMKSIAPHF